MNERLGRLLAAWDAYWSRLQAIYPAVRRPEGPLTADGRVCRHAKAFDALVDWCEQNKIDPRQYIAGALPLVRSACSAIVPQDLNRPAIRRQYQALSRKHMTGAPVEIWAVQARVLKQLRWLNPGLDSDEGALNQICVNFYCWFRVMYPEQPVPGLIERFGEEAWREMKSDRVLREFLYARRPATYRALEQHVAAFGDF